MRTAWNQMRDGRVEILESTWYIHELTDELIPVAYAYCEKNGIEIQQG